MIKIFSNFYDTKDLEQVINSYIKEWGIKIDEIKFTSVFEASTGHVLHSVLIKYS